MTSWQDKRINEINKMCKSRSAVVENFIEEVYDIYQSKADSYDEFVIEQKEKAKRKEKESLINREKWRNYEIK